MLARLLLDDGDWALGALTQWLDAISVAHVVVWALELGLPLSLVERLRFDDGSTRRPPLRRVRLLHRAAANACWRAVAVLQRDPRHYRERRDPASIDARIREGTGDWRWRQARPPAAVRAEWAEHLRRRSGPHVRRCIDELRRRLHVAKVPGERFLRWFLRFRPCPFPARVVYEAARLGNLVALEFFHLTTPYDAIELLAFAARGGHVAAVDWALGRVEALEPTGRDDYKLPRSILRRDQWLLGDHHELVMWRVNVGLGDRPLHTVHAVSSRWGRPDGGVYPLIDYAAADGDLGALEAIYAQVFGPHACSPRAMHAAVSAGHLEVVEWLFARPFDVEWGANLLNVAVRWGHLRVAQWLRVHRPEQQLTATTVRLLSGDRELFDWAYRELHPHTPEIAQAFVSRALGHGYVDVISKMRADMPEIRVEREAVLTAARDGHWEAITTALAGWPLSELDASGSINSVLAGPHPEAVEWVIENLDLWPTESMWTLSLTLEALEVLYKCAERHSMVLPKLSLPYWGHYLRQNRLDVIRWAESKHLLDDEPTDIENWYHPTKACWMNDQTCGWTAMRVKYAFDLAEPETAHRMCQTRLAVGRAQSYCPNVLLLAPGENVLRAIERGGRIPPQFSKPSTLSHLLENSRDPTTMKWLLTHFPHHFSKRLLQWTIKYRLLSLLKFLADRFVFVPVNKPSFITECVVFIIKGAARRGNLPILEWINGRFEDHLTGIVSKCDLDWIDVFKHAARFGHQQVLEWISAQGYVQRRAFHDGPGSPIDIAAKCGQLRCAQWLYHHFQLRCSDEAVARAQQLGFTEVVVWAMQTQGLEAY